MCCVVVVFSDGSIYGLISSADAIKYEGVVGLGRVAFLDEAESTETIPLVAKDVVSPSISSAGKGGWPADSQYPCRGDQYSTTTTTTRPLRPAAEAHLRSCATDLVDDSDS
ncbi:hypothetical protein ABZP36_014698 [Zizania latifolia]